MNIVVFAGAGFSAPFGLPVMGNFFQVARTSPTLSESQIEILDKIIGESNQANRIVSTSPTNLESVLSMAVMGERLGIGEERSEEILKIIGRVYRQVNDTNNYWNQFKKLENTLGFKLSRNHLHIKFITTNYDLCLESALYSSNLSTEDYFAYKEESSNHLRLIGDFHKSFRKKVPIYKLHGSVNWFNSDIDGEIIVDSRIVPVGRMGEEYSLPYPLTSNYGDISNYQTERKPLLIPPSFLKPDFGSKIRRIWASAARVLQEADTIVFIGYSFPQSDTEMKFFLGKALESNVRLNKIHILDTNANEIVARLKNSVSGYGSHFLEYLIPHNDDWTNTKLNLL